MKRGGGIVSPADVVAAGLCIGCGSCVGQSKDSSARMIWDQYGQLKPQDDDWLHVASEIFSRTCPFAPRAANEDELAELEFPSPVHVDGRIGRFEAAYVGHANEHEFRATGTSGGMISWVAAELLRRGLVDGVAHVAPADPHADGRFFGYRISRSEDEVRQGAKSRYYPIELSGVLDEIRATPGRYAVVGIPCFIKAVNLLRAENPLYRERIVFTLGLVCGHMKSARFVESFAWQMGVEPNGVNAVEYRIKDPERPANWYTAQLTLNNGNVHRQDWWHLVDGDWGSGFFQNHACNYCDDVVAETADISFGDAWVEPYSSDGRGTNVVVVRSPQLHEIVQEAIAQDRLALNEVDAEFVVNTQAAGFRQRREGLSYRLKWRGAPLGIRKRVRPGAPATLRRKLVYRARYNITVWSHRIFNHARRTYRPALYLRFGRHALAVYQALTYSRGRLGELFDRIFASRAPSRKPK